MQMIEMYQSFFFPSQKLVIVCSMCIERHRKDTLHHFPLFFFFCTQIKDKDAEEKIGRKELTKRLQNLLFGDLGGK